MLAGHVAGTPALLVSAGGEFFAIGAKCTHYGGSLVEGLLVEKAIRCPLHHACFSVQTGEVLGAPALDRLKTWRVEQQRGRVYVNEELPAPPITKLASQRLPNSVVIVGGGGAGQAAAETLRREGYPGRITMLASDPAIPYDRPNLSKDYLAGQAKPEWMPLRPHSFYTDNGIDLRTNVRVEKIDRDARDFRLSDGTKLDYDALLLATGADPVRLQVPGASLPHVCQLRTMNDADKLIGLSRQAKNCVIVGAGFIGLECAASLRTRGLAVHVVAPSQHPLQHALGEELGDMLRHLHETNGVTFHLGTKVIAIEARQVTLANGSRLDADLVVVGIGVRPNVDLAKTAGLDEDNGIIVNHLLETSDPHIYAAGDVARWIDPRSGSRTRVEHWVVAQRMGATAARNILGLRHPFAVVPFFWSQQYDVAVKYVGHADRWDRLEIDGDPATHDCAVSYWQEGSKLAVATVGRDLQSLESEATLEECLKRAR